MGNLDILELAKNLVINIANILIIFVIVRALVYKPVKKFLAAREERVASARAQADEKAAQAEKSNAEYQKLLAEAEDLKVRSRAEGEKEGRQSAEQIISRAKERAEGIIAEAKTEGEAEKAKMLEDARDEIVDLTLGVTEKILEREITDEDNRKIIDEFLA